MVFHTSKENIISLLCLEVKHNHPLFLKYHESFVNTKERLLFYQVPALEKISFYSKKSLISTFPLSKKFIIRTFPFFLIRTFLSCKFHVANFSLSFIETYIFLHIFKDHFNLHYKRKCETELRNFFSLIFQWLKHDICQCWWHQRSLESGSGT